MNVRGGYLYFDTPIGEVGVTLDRIRDAYRGAEEYGDCSLDTGWAKLPTMEKKHYLLRLFREDGVVTLSIRWIGTPSGTRKFPISIPSKMLIAIMI